MYVCWKPLLLLGFLFWAVLFSSDVLRRHKVVEQIMQVYSPESIISSPPKKAAVEPKKSTVALLLETTSSDKLSSDFGLTMILVNIIVFVVSIVFGTIAKLAASVICKFLKRTRVVHASNLLKTKTHEKGPIGDSPEENIQSKSVEVIKITSSSNTELVQRVDQISQTNLPNPLPTKYDHTLRMEYSRLKEELLTVQTNSIKEHALLSRKLDAISKEKKDLNKRLNVSIKENSAAKTQIDELVEEKKTLEKRLENAIKDLRLSTKTKKVALAKLEEISASIDDLKGELEQTTRDKEILQNKLSVLRGEYEMLQERVRLMQIKEKNRLNEELSTTREIAEKDESVNERTNDENSTTESSQSSLNQIMSKESVFLPYVISQTELDMKNIQEKILQLEKSIEGFGTRADILEEISKIDEEAERNLLEATNKSSGEAEKLDDRLGTALEKIKNTREDLTCKKTYDEIKVSLLRNALKEKIRALESTKEKGDEHPSTASPSEDTSLGDEEFEMSSEEAASPRFLSNSQAFQKFLRNIGAETTLISVCDIKSAIEAK